MRKLKDVCEKASSNIKQSDLQNNEGAYPIFGASGFIKNVDFYQRDKPYVAVVKDGAGAGRVMRLPAFSSVIGTMQYIIPNEGINVRYLAYAMEFMDLSRYSMGATIPHIYFKDYGAEELPDHSEQEQERIASTLEKIDGLISLRQRQLEKLDELLKARFAELFGKRKYEHCKLHSVAKISSGLTKNGSKRAAYPKKMLYLRVANVFFNHLDLTDIREIGVLDSEIDKTLLEKDDLLFVEGNGSPEQIGRVSLWDGSIFPMLHQNHIIKARFDKNVILPHFAMSYFMTQEGREQILKSAATTSGLYTLSLNKISEFVIPCPPLETQEYFADVISQIDKSKFAIRKGLDKLETLKAALMRKYFDLRD